MDRNESGLGWKQLRTHLSALMSAAVLVTALASWAQDTALIIGNDTYDPGCAGNLPGVVGDVTAMNGALQGAGWQTVVRRNIEAAQILAEIILNKPAAGKKYLIYYAGHGDNDVGENGQWLGPNCSAVFPAQLVGALGDDASRTLVILDSCGGGQFAAVTDALEPRIGFLTSTTGLQCASNMPSFTQCFVVGLNGAADADGDGTVTVQEAWNYANANCSQPGQVPTWDGDFPDWIIGSAGGPIFCEHAAGCNCVLNPIASYTGATNKCSFGTDATTNDCKAGATVEARFDSAMSVGQVPDDWQTWSSPPYSETATPRVAFTSNDTVTVTLQDGFEGTTVGAEIENDVFDPTLPIVVSFRRADGSQAARITRPIHGFAGARLFAVSCDATSIKSLAITADPGAIGFGIAQLRSTGFQATVPEESIAGKPRFAKPKSTFANWW